MDSSNDVKEEVLDERSEQISEHEAGEEPAATDVSGQEHPEGEGGDVELEDAEVDAQVNPEGEDEENEDRGDGNPEGEDDDRAADYDPTFDQTLLKPLFERREKSLKELLESMDEFSPIIPDAVTDYYLARSGLKTNDQRIKRLLALATQKFVSDIASDAYQYARIRSQTGGAAGAANRGRGGQGAASANRTVLTMESLSGILGDYGINTKRPDFYR